MKLTMEMPVVSECYVRECTYNNNQACQAKAITVGDGIHACCDTYLNSACHVHDTRGVAGVGACKNVECMYNEDYKCNAGQITIGRNQGETYCMNYSPMREKQIFTQLVPEMYLVSRR